ncbi:hypothetical protein Ctob_016451, partial [Chrysochromulina tobinii]|eukprot:jgi/Chrpa1/21721/Chrysochromulina_OHIO_Genome00026269-RA
MNVEMQVAQGQMIQRMNDTAGVMMMMNKLAKVEAVQETMQAFQREMTKAGIIEEMVDDVMDTVDEADDEDAADEEVAKILTELNAEAMGGAKSAATHQAYESAKAADGDEEEDMAMLR